MQRKLGTQVILDFYGCKKNTEDVLTTREVFLEAAKLANCNIISDCFHGFEPHGVSGVVIISESNFCVHSWPEHQYVAIDLFFCGDNVKIDCAIEYLEQFYEPNNTRVQTIIRG